MRARVRRIKSVFFSKKCILNLFYMLCFHEREELAHSFSAATHTGCVPHSVYTSIIKFAKCTRRILEGMDFRALYIYVLNIGVPYEVNSRRVVATPDIFSRYSYFAGSPYNYVSSQDALKALEIDLSDSRQLGRWRHDFSRDAQSTSLLCTILRHVIFIVFTSTHVFTFFRVYISSLSCRSSLERNTILSSKIDLCRDLDDVRIPISVRGLHNRDFAVSQDFLRCRKFRTRA